MRSSCVLELEKWQGSGGKHRHCCGDAEVLTLTPAGVTGRADSRAAAVEGVRVRITLLGRDHGCSKAPKECSSLFARNKHINNQQSWVGAGGTCVSPSGQYSQSCGCQNGLSSAELCRKHLRKQQEDPWGRWRGGSAQPCGGDPLNPPHLKWFKYLTNYSPTPLGLGLFFICTQMLI